MRRIQPVFVALLVLSLAGCAWIERSSVSSAPANVEGNGLSDGPALSQGGGFVAFESLASNLVPGDTNGVSDVFVREHRTEKTTRVSIATNGSQANGANRRPTISDDGRYVAFETDASNLAGPDPDSKQDVVVRDRKLGTTTVVSIDPAGAAITDPAVAPAISGDGRTVAFIVRRPFQSTTVDAGPFVRDLDAGVTRQMPDTYGEFVVLGRSPLSDDGGRIVYGQLTPLGDEAAFAVVVADTENAAILKKLVSGQFTHQSQGSFDDAISGDGATVVVTLAAPGFGVGEVHRYDAVSGIGGKILDGLYLAPALSDGAGTIGLRRLDYTAYVVTAGNGTALRLVSANSTGTPATDVGGTDLSGDGRFVAFGSRDPDLVAQDANDTSDVFARAVTPGNKP